jgi:hypothetical protein
VISCNQAIRAFEAIPVFLADRGFILGIEASEQSVKSADLSNHEVIYFATHGLLPGDPG